MPRNQPRGFERRNDINENESNGDYEVTAAQKPHFDLSDKKSTLEFLVEIQAMTDYDHSKSTKFIDRVMQVSEFLIWQVVSKDIHTCEMAIFIRGHEEQEYRPCCKPF